MDLGRATSEDELRILIIGKTGVGKSTTGNTILGRKYFEASAISKSVTKKCQWGKRSFNGKSVVVVDTPGLFDTGMSLEETKKKIAAFTGIISPGPHAIVLVLKIGQRYTKHEQETVNFFVKMFGEDIYKHMIVLFTFRNLLDEEEEEITFDDYLNTLEGDLKGVIQRSSYRCIAFGKDENAKRTNDAERLIDLINSHIGSAYYSNETLKKVEETNMLITEEMKREEATLPDEDLKSKLRKDYENEGKWYQRFLKLVGDFLYNIVGEALNVVGTVLILKLKSLLGK